MENVMASAREQQLRGDTQPTMGLVVPLLVTLAMLAAIRFLHHIPIAGVAEFAARDHASNMARFSIVAVALQAWLVASILMQLVVMIAPEKWTRNLIRNGYVNPFGLVVLLLTAGVAYSQASGIAVAFETMIQPINNKWFQFFVIGSLVAGTGIIIACSWLIERFGLGRGFWIVLAAQSIIDMANSVSQPFMMMNSGALGTTAIIMAPAAVIIVAVFIILVTLHVKIGGGKLELVAWPLLLTNVASIPMMLPFLGLFDADPDTKGMPENIPAYLAGSLVTLALIVFFLTRREAKQHLFVPIFGVLALIELASYGALHLRPDYHVMLPLPTGGFVAMIAVFTVLVQQLRQHGISHSKGDGPG
jgi:hypothetical protein